MTFLYLVRRKKLFNFFYCISCDLFCYYGLITYILMYSKLKCSKKKAITACNKGINISTISLSTIIR